MQEELESSNPFLQLPLGTPWQALAHLATDPRLLYFTLLTKV